MAVMVMANRTFHLAGIPITDSQAASKMAETLGSAAVPLGFYVYSVGFWVAVSTSLLGVWQSVPYMFADYYGLLRGYPRPVRRQMTQVSSTPYRLALLFIAIVPIPLVLIGRPLALIFVYTVVGSLFIPFLAATLLYLNNRVSWSTPIRKNGPITNLLLFLILALFLLIGTREISALLS